MTYEKPIDRARAVLAICTTKGDWQSVVDYSDTLDPDDIIRAMLEFAKHETAYALARVPTEERVA